MGRCNQTCQFIVIGTWSAWTDGIILYFDLVVKLFSKLTRKDWWCIFGTDPATYSDRNNVSNLSPDGNRRRDIYQRGERDMLGFPQTAGCFVTFYISALEILLLTYL